MYFKRRVWNFTHVVLQLIQITSWYTYHLCMCEHFIHAIIVTDRFQF